MPLLALTTSLSAAGRLLAGWSRNQGTDVCLADINGAGAAATSLQRGAA
jgi:hypothetical protein